MSTILITGATSGLGEALALEAIAHGHEVVACGRNTDKLAELALHENISTLAFDVSDKTETQAALADLRCDIAVLNAGTCEYVNIDKVDPDLFKRVFDINLFGVINVVSALLPNLQKGNKLVFVDSMARLLPFTRSQAYGASKAAVHYACKSFAVDLQRKGIAVQSMSPGFVKTPLTNKNDFPMPMAITAKEAGRYMLKGILTNKASVYFPRRFGVIVRLLNLLPEYLQYKICVSMRSKGTSSKEEVQKHSKQDNKSHREQDKL